MKIIPSKDPTFSHEIYRALGRRDVGLVAGFVQWMLGQGLALASVNRKLSTVKVYAGLAAKAGGWTSMAMVQRYVDETKSANEGMGDD